MADLTPRLDSRINIQSMIAVIALLVGGAIAWGTSQGSITALAQRVEAGEKRDDETSKTLGTVKESIIELKGDNKAIRSDIERQGRQLDRIEQLIRSQPATPSQVPR